MEHSSEKLGNTLQTLLQDLGIENKIKQYRIINQWPEIVGEQVARHTQAEKIRDNILYVKVKSMTWRTELLFQKPHILNRISEQVGRDLIRDIRFL